MLEVDFLAEITNRTDMAWNVIQWWASITFAVLLAVHLTARDLTALLMTIILVLYSLLTIATGQAILVHNAITNSALEGLQLLSNDTIISRVGETVLVEYVSGIRVAAGTTLFVTLIVTYFATIFFIIYSYRVGVASSKLAIKASEGNT